MKRFLSSHASAFSARDVRDWTERQFNAWKFSKENEAGGRDHIAYVPFEQLSPRDQIFQNWLTRGILEYLRFSGRESLEELRENGRRLLSAQVILSQTGIENPYLGVPTVDGGTIQIRPDLAGWIAFSHHRCWLRCRERSWMLPYEELWQPKFRSDNAHQEWELNNPTPAWSGDVRFAYGLARELARLSETSFRNLLSVTAPGSLPANPLNNTLRPNDLAAWCRNYVVRSETWRKAPELQVHSGDASVESFKPEEMFDHELAVWVLDFLRLFGGDALLHLAEVGEKGASRRSAPQIDRAFDPERGIELDDGSRAMIDPELLRELRDEYQRHFHLTAEWTQLIPFRRARRAVPKADPRRDATRIYGIAHALALGSAAEKSWLHAIAC